MNILLAEQDVAGGAATADCLRDIGLNVVGPLPTVGEACRAAERDDIKGAVCKLNLADGSTEDLIALLRQRGVPVILNTVTLPSLFPRWARDIPYIRRPYEPSALQALARRAFSPADGTPVPAIARQPGSAMQPLGERERFEMRIAG